MNRLFGCARRFGARFKQDQNGSATVEAVLWIPIFALVLGLLVDTSMIFHGQSKVIRVVQDANRNISIGRLTTETEVETYITDQLATFGVTPSDVTATSDGNVVLTNVTVPVSQFQILQYFTSLMNLEVDVRGAHVLDSADIDTMLASMAATATY